MSSNAVQRLTLAVVFLLLIVNNSGKFLPQEYTGFMLSTKRIERHKRNNPRPLAISSPISYPMSLEQKQSIRLNTREVVQPISPV